MLQIASGTTLLLQTFLSLLNFKTGAQLFLFQQMNSISLLGKAVQPEWCNMQDVCRHRFNTTTLFHIYKCVTFYWHSFTHFLWELLFSWQSNTFITPTSRLQWIEPSLHDSEVLLRGRADRRDKARKNIPEIQETNWEQHGSRREWQMYIFYGVLSYFGKSQNSPVVCLWSLQTILMYTCMLKIISPSFYCAVMLMDSCVTFYFHYNFCKEHGNSNALVTCKLPQCTLPWPCHYSVT